MTRPVADAFHDVLVASYDDEQQVTALGLRLIGYGEPRDAPAVRRGDRRLQLHRLDGRDDGARLDLLACRDAEGDDTAERCGDTARDTAVLGAADVRYREGLRHHAQRTNHAPTLRVRGMVRVLSCGQPTCTAASSVASSRCLMFSSPTTRSVPSSSMPAAYQKACVEPKVCACNAAWCVASAI